MKAKSLHRITEADEDKAERAIKLIERAGLMPAKFAFSLRESGYVTATQKFERAMGILPHLLEFASDIDSPDQDFWRDYYELTGLHMICGDEGWEPGENKASYLADDPNWQPLDEVNAPQFTEPSKEAFEKLSAKDIVELVNRE